MPQESGSYRRQAREIGHLAFRHAFLPINAIIFSVVILLVIFGDTQEGIFLGAIVLVNIALGFGQDVRAWFTLEHLQLLTALRVVRVNADGSESHVLLHQIGKGDELRVRLGDQIPCDSALISDSMVEVNEGLITGESDSFPRTRGQRLLAGSVVTSGAGIIRVETPFSESVVAKMTEGLKRYSANPSPIQISIQRIITYTVYILLATIAVVVARGVLLHEPNLRIVENIGALASVLVPQGLVVSVTLLFTFGAAHFYNRHVLLQEVNATEKFGHIKNLCMDKTGTLTENALTVEHMEVPDKILREEARTLSATYVNKSGDSSQVIQAIKEFLGDERGGDASDVVSFSSWRQYGGVCLGDGVPSACVLAGVPEIFLSHLASEQERKWLELLIAERTRAGKHILCMVRSVGSQVAAVPRELSDSQLSVVAVFVLGNRLREGIKGAVDFFQARGIVIRILSGDNPETARVVAHAAGVNNTDLLITGPEMEGWSAADYTQNSKRYVIFARIKPEQKERIVEALKTDGFTAMIGDGANDALSLKKADLGIAMADGSSATRQIAAVILTKNSFVELPGGVRLADSMIENIEIFASIFLNQTFVSFLLFVGLTIAGFDFPLSPLNISLINYFAVGLPGTLISYWAIRPAAKTTPVSKAPFLSRVLPLPSALSWLQTITIGGVFGWALTHNVGTPVPLLVTTFVALGYIYFLLTPRIHSGGVTLAQRTQLLCLGIVEAIFLYWAFTIALIAHFFNVSPPPGTGLGLVGIISLVCGAIMFVFALLLRLRHVKR